MEEDEILDGVYLYATDVEELKAVKPRVAHGVGIRFSNPLDTDSYNEFFTKETATGLRNGDSRPFLFEHGYGKFGVEVLGYAVFDQTDIGWEYDVTFEDTSNGNEAYSLVTNAPFYSSSGAAYNTVRRDRQDDAWFLKSWLIAEMTATQKPADKSNQRITRLKSVGAEAAFARIAELEFKLKNFETLVEGFDKMKEFYYSFIEQQKLAELDAKIKAAVTPIKTIK